MYRQRLIAPGPVEISPAVQLALASRQLHHRSPEAKTVVKRARELLRIVAGVSDAIEPIILTSSGTGAFEARWQTRRCGHAPSTVSNPDWPHGCDWLA